MYHYLQKGCTSIHVNVYLALPPNKFSISGREKIITERLTHYDTKAVCLRFSFQFVSPRRPLGPGRFKRPRTLIFSVKICISPWVHFKPMSEAGRKPPNIRTDDGQFIFFSRKESSPAAAACWLNRLINHPCMCVCGLAGLCMLACACVPLFSLSSALLQDILNSSIKCCWSARYSCIRPLNIHTPVLTANGKWEGMRDGCGYHEALGSRAGGRGVSRHTDLLFLSLPIPSSEGQSHLASYLRFLTLLPCLAFAETGTLVDPIS